MQKKSGKYLADWRDSNGQRKRRAFDSKPKALKFQAKMQHETAAKKAHGSGPSRTSARPGGKPTPGTPTAKSPKNSRRSPGRSTRTNYHKSTSTRSTPTGESASQKTHTTSTHNA
jgi:hypothetical protein